VSLIYQTIKTLLKIKNYKKWGGVKKKKRITFAATISSNFFIRLSLRAEKKLRFFLHTTHIITNPWGCKKKVSLIYQQKK
jgi:hypothetical protein